MAFNLYSEEFKKFNDHDFLMIKAYSDAIMNNLLFLEGLKRNIININNSDTYTNFSQADIDFFVSLFESEVNKRLKFIDSLKLRFESIEKDLYNQLKSNPLG